MPTPPIEKKYYKRLTSKGELEKIRQKGGVGGECIGDGFIDGRMAAQY